MKPAPFDYLAPTTVEAALEHLAQAGGEATVLAGGQTLMPLLSLRMSTAAVLVDINRIAALKGVARADDGVRIAAAKGLGTLQDERALRQVDVGNSERIGVSHRRAARQRADVVFHSEPLKAPLDRVLAFDVLHVGIDLIAIAGLS